MGGSGSCCPFLYAVRPKWCFLMGIRIPGFSWPLRVRIDFPYSLGRSVEHTLHSRGSYSRDLNLSRIRQWTLFGLFWWICSGFSQTTCFPSPCYSVSRLPTCNTSGSSQDSSIRHSFSALYSRLTWLRCPCLTCPRIPFYGSSCYFSLFGGAYHFSKLFLRNNFRVY